MSRSHGPQLQLPSSVPAIHITHFLLGADGALRHMKMVEDKLRTTFSHFQILPSCYSTHAGFNESLIRDQIGYIEEIHVFTLAEIPEDSPLVFELGNIFSPYPGILFTPTSSYQTPVFKEDGSIWDFDELVFSQHNHPSCAISPENIVAQTCSELNDAGDSSAPSSHGGQQKSDDGGNQKNEEGGDGDQKDNKDQGPPGGRDSQKGNEPDEDPGDEDPADPAERDADAVPDVSFDILANIYCGSNNIPSALLQKLQINGTLTAQVSSTVATIEGCKGVEALF